MNAPSLETLMARAQGRFVAAPVSAPGQSPAHPSLPAPLSPASAPGMTTFLRTVLPSAGGFLLMELGKSGARHVRHESIGALADALRTRSDAGANVYFALAGYKPASGVSRKKQDVQCLRSLFLDIDCGKGAHTYGDDATLEAALGAFVAAIGIQPTAVVHSGGGRHVYWALDTDLTVEAWEPLASALKRYSEAWGLLADHAVTADAARVLRAPDTRTKHGNKARLLWLGSEVSVSDMREGLERLRQSLPNAASRLFGMPAASSGLQGNVPDASAPSIAGTPPATLTGSLYSSPLSQGLPSRSDWLYALGPGRQLALLDEMMMVCPDAFWSQEPWWVQVVHAVAALDHLPQDVRLDLLVKHSARSPKWTTDGWDRDRLFRDKWSNANGTASLTSLIQTAEQAGWQRPVDVVIPTPFADRDALASHLAATYIHVAEQNAYLNRRTRALISRDGVVESESWRVPLDSERPINLAHLLRTDRRIERVDAIAYAPGESSIYVRAGRRLANRFQSWAPTMLVPTAEDVALLQAFLTYVTPDDEGKAFRRWIWQALAWLVKHPGARLPVAVLLAGAQGCGKSTLLETIPRLLFGPHNVASVTPGELDSPFNDWLGNSRILTMPELRMGSARDARRVADVLKPIITSPIVRIHPKGAKGYEQENVLSIFATSNHGDAVHLDDDDRRWVVYESSADRMPDDLASKVYALLDGPRGAGVLRGMVEAMDVSTFNPHALPLLNTSKRRMMEASRSNIESSLIGRFERREFPFDRPLVTIEDCRAALIEDGIEWRGNSPQAIAKVLQARPIQAECLGRFRVQPRGIGVMGMPPALVHEHKRCRVYVARRDDPAKWRQADEDFMRKVLVPGATTSPAPSGPRDRAGTENSAGLVPPQTQL